MAQRCRRARPEARHRNDADAVPRFRHVAGTPHVRVLDRRFPNFCWFLEGRKPLVIATTAVLAILPLLVAMDVAACSSKCDVLRAELNDKRIKTLDARLPVHAINDLDQALDRLNRNKGLGFWTGAHEGCLVAFVAKIVVLRPSRSRSEQALPLLSVIQPGCSGHSCHPSTEHT